MKKVKLVEDDYPLVKRRNPTLDEIGEFVHVILRNVSHYGKNDEETKMNVRIIIKHKFGKRIAKKYTDKELEDAWYQYELQ